MDVSADLSGYVQTRANGAAEIDFAVQGILCGTCIGVIERAIARMQGAPKPRLNYTMRRLHVSWTAANFNPADVARVLAPLGYTVRPFDLAASEDEDARRSRALMRCLAIAGFAAMNVMLLSVSIWAGNASDIDDNTRDMFHWISALIALPAAFFAGQPFFLSALGALRARSLNMDVPISLGVSLALVMSVFETATHAHHAYYESALMLLFFLLAGRVLDDAMRSRTRAIVNNFASLRAFQAFRVNTDGGITEVPVKALRHYDVVLVRPGEKFPIDGKILSGSSEIDDSLVTGESSHRCVEADDPVYAGAINLSGTVRAEVHAAGNDTLLHEIERLLETASSGKSRYVLLADRVARYYAPAVHLGALVTAIGWFLAGASLHDAIVAAIAVLIVTCPCALALAIPAVHVVASGSLFRRGLLLRKADALERLAEVDTVVFDKTGTLTRPEPGIANRAKVPADLLAIAARLALSSRHPLARGIAVEAGASSPFDNVVEESGRGVRTIVDGEELRLGSPDFCGIDADYAGDASRLSVIAVRHGARCCTIQVKQVLRPDAAACIAWLKQTGIGVEILSGDNLHAVNEVAVKLGIEAAQGGIKPAEKVRRLEDLRAQGRRVLMVGDGLNDAPALAAAHASLSPSTAADVSQSVADAIFLGDRLQPVCDAITGSRRAMRLMRENLWLAAIYNILAVPLAVFGVLTPLLAAAGMSGSSLLVTLNALRARDIDEHSIKQSRKSRRSQPQISAPLTAGVGT
jgi:Cu2+-exporting ATPase